MKMIKFYTDNNKYMGFTSVKSYGLQYLELRSWILSGNYIIFNNQIIKKVNHILNIFGFNF